MVSWKYGLKSGKSLVRSKLLEKQPATTWNTRQATERRLEELGGRPTPPFNGSGNEVSSLYAAMDLKVSF